MGVRAATCIFVLGEGELREPLNTPLEHVFSYSRGGVGSDRRKMRDRDI